MKRLLVGGAGGTPSNNFIQSIRESSEKLFIIGMTSDPYDLCKANVEKRHLIPNAKEKDYYLILEDIINENRPEFIHVQNDFEVLAISKFRNRLKKKNVITCLPKHESVENCINKLKSCEIWEKSEIEVPKSLIINDEHDLKEAFKNLGNIIWIRSIKGAAGNGALPTSNVDFAKSWIDYFDGWGKFMAAEYLSPTSVTWMSLWDKGKLIVAQGRKRLNWAFNDRTLSGVTGITGTGITVSDPVVDKIAQKAILSIDSRPHGVWSVDMTYDSNGMPNPTEINIGRFFTTSLFFTKLGLNMPYIYLKLAFGEELPEIKKKINPLPSDYAWIRGMDTEPVLTNMKKISEYENDLKKRRNLYV